MQVVPTDTRVAKRRHLLRDFALYLIISVTVVSALGWAAVSEVPEATILGWFLFGLFTVFILGEFVWNSRAVWNDRVFWCGTAILLLANFLIFHRFYWSGGHVSAFGLIVLAGIEGAIFRAFRRWREKATSTAPNSEPQA